MDTLRADERAPLTSSPALTIDETILELLPAAVYVCDAEGLIVRYNRRAAELWGRSPRRGETEERFCGAHRLLRPDGRPLPHHRTPMAEVLRTGVPKRDAEIQIERPDGTRLWALVNIEPIRNGAGAMVGAVNCFQDITARKRAEAEARENEALYRAVIDTTPECVKIVARDGTVRHMNPAGLRMVGADDAGTVHGRSVFGLIAPECRNHWQACHERVCDGESFSWEFDIIGLNGTRRHMETHAVPLRMPDGAVAQLAVTRDITRRKRDEETLRDSERRSRELLAALPTAVYTTDAAGRITSYNEAAAAFWGVRPALGRSEWCGSWRLYRPDGKPLPHDRCPMAVALKECRPIRGAEAMAERPDGSRVPFLAYPTPLYDGTGALAGAVNMLVDITDRKQAEERQKLLVNELNHRVKNTLATVQSIAAQSFRGEVDGRAYKWFESRLIALSTAHDVLTRRNWEGASFREIVAQAVAPLSGRCASRFDIDGPDLRLTPKTALSLAMALHELCTNAAKHGALSNASGRVTVRWRVERDSAGDRLCLRWAETGGPPVEAPRRKGFGSRLIERGLAYDLKAEVRLAYHPGGVACEIDAPLGRPALP
ncbi:MAG TPA: PAS domain S-box protein [Alphaproteobacteria bacterium]|nr:PAS domain S-box protein [Alphaproteobacteria bacterium]